MLCCGCYASTLYCVTQGWSDTKGSRNDFIKSSLGLVLEDSKVNANPQSIELHDNTTFTNSYIRSLGIAKQNFYYKPIDYTASTTFKRYDYTKAGVDRDSVQFFQTAGYPQIPQVDYTVFSQEDLLNLDVTQLEANNTVWVANKSNSDWDVFRILNTGVTISDLAPINSGTQMKISFNTSHTLVGPSRTVE